ncbi:MAG: hypothetical protein ACRDGN_10300 [bacterium]
MKEPEDLRDRLRSAWRRAMPLRASRPRGVRRRPRDPGEARALREVALRVGRRAFSTWIRQTGPRNYRLQSSCPVR